MSIGGVGGPHEFTFRRPRGPLLPILPSDPRGIVLAFARMNEPFERIWVRDKTRWLYLNLPDLTEGYSRSTVTTHLSWGKRSSSVTPQHVAIVMGADEPFPGSARKYTAEVYRVLDDGKMRAGNSGGPGDFPRRYYYETDASQADGPVVTIPPSVYIGSPLPAISDAVYRVDKSGEENPWLTVGAQTHAYFGWDYDLPDGTPTNVYDLRAFCQARTTENEVEYPPPAKRQSLIGAGTYPYDVGCFRWTSNSQYDPLDPTSPPWIIRAYNYSIDDEEAPDGSPTRLGSTWDSVATPPPDVPSQYHNPQAIDLGLAGRIGGTWYENTKKFVWGHVKGFYGESGFLYCYTCSFTTVRKNAIPTTDVGRQFFREIREWDAEGLRVLLNDNIVYDDAPSGITSIGRTNDGPFPSEGGYLVITGPEFTRTFRGMAGRGQISEHYVYGNLYGRPGGDFYVLVHDVDIIPSEVTSLKVASSASEVALVGIGDDAPYAWAAEFKEVNGRLYGELRRL